MRRDSVSASAEGDTPQTSAWGKSCRRKGGSNIGAAEPRVKMFHLAKCQMKPTRSRAERRG